MRISISAEKCTGQGRCYSLAAEVFEPDDEGYNASMGHTVEVAPDQAAAARTAVANCPERALTIE